MIEGVKVKTLRVIPDERGRLDDDSFLKFGQVYMTTAYPGVVKGWHYHSKQVDNFAVVRGMIKLVLYDRRKDSSTSGEIDEIFIGEQNPKLVQIPALVLHGFKCIGTEEAIVINCPTEVYNYQEPDEHRIDPASGEVPYDWAIKMK
jgi:dTDP-4-dehydrorhamnose 3,5-epimerase